MRHALSIRQLYVLVAIAAALLSGTYYLIKLRQECGGAPLGDCARQVLTITEPRPNEGRAPEMELAFWMTVKDAKSIVLLQAYLERYPNGHFAVLAHALIDHLQKEKSAREAAARGQEKIEAAEDALAAAKQAEQLAKQAKELDQARAAIKRAEAEKDLALRAAEQAGKEAAQAKAGLQRVIEEAEKQAKVVTASTPEKPVAATDAKVPISQEPRTVSEPSKAGAHAIGVELGKAKPLRSVAVSKDGSLIAFAGDDGYVRLLRAADLKLERTLKGHRDRVYAIAFSPDGKALASAGWDGAIKLWTLTTGDVENLTSGTDKFYSVAFDPKVPLKYVLAGDSEGNVHIWDLQKKARVSKPEEHNGPVRAISFYPDMSGTFVSMGGDGTMRARSFKSGMKDIDAHASGGFFAAYSMDGGTVLTAGGDKKLKLWQSSDFRLMRSFEGHSKYVLTAALSPDRKTIASGGGDGMVLLWDMHSGQILRKFARHEADIECVSFYHDGTRLVSVSEDKTLRVWDTSSGEQLAVAVGFADGEYLAYSKDGIYTASDGGHPYLKVLEDGAERVADKETKARLFSPSGLAISSR
jgi:WD40 repeat protein